MQKKILYFLKESNGYRSGEELSRTMKISRAAIWKNIEELRKHGYLIEAIPHLGYRLVSAPDKLFPWEIQHHLGTKVIGQRVIAFETTRSTMDAAFELGFGGAQEGLVICAEGQTQGRGRMGRSWVSPKGKGIYVSLILHPRLSPVDVPKITLLSAVVACEVLRQVSGLEVHIKWPNDLLIQHRKIGGILTELSAEVDRIKFVVVGLGLNINTLNSQLPRGATSLKAETHRAFNRVDIVKEFLRAFEKWYDVLNKKEFDVILKRWKELSVMLGKRVRFHDARGVGEGIAADLAEDGGLLIRDDKGRVSKKMSGDVVLIH